MSLGAHTDVAVSEDSRKQGTKRPGGLGKTGRNLNRQLVIDSNTGTEVCKLVHDFDVAICQRQTSSRRGSAFMTMHLVLPKLRARLNLVATVTNKAAAASMFVTA